MMQRKLVTAALAAMLMVSLTSVAAGTPFASAASAPHTLHLYGAMYAKNASGTATVTKIRRWPLQRQHRGQGPAESQSIEGEAAAAHLPGLGDRR